MTCILSRRSAILYFPPLTGSTGPAGAGLGGAARPQQRQRLPPRATKTKERRYRCYRCTARRALGLGRDLENTKTVEGKGGAGRAVAGSDGRTVLTGPFPAKSSKEGECALWPIDFGYHRGKKIGQAEQEADLP